MAKYVLNFEIFYHAVFLFLNENFHIFYILDFLRGVHLHAWLRYTSNNNLHLLSQDYQNCKYEQGNIFF